MGVKVRFERGFFWIIIHKDGRRTKKKVGKSRQEAERIAEQIRMHLILEGFGADTDIEPAPAFDVFAVRWFDTEVRIPSERGLPGAHARNTVRNRDIFLQRHLIPFFGDRPLDSIRPADIQRFHDEAMRRGELSTSTINTILGTLRLILAHAHVQELVASNAVDVWKSGRGRRKGTAIAPVSGEKVLSHEELEELLATSASHFAAQYPLMLFLADTGVRIGEACGLQWQDLDLANGTARIARSADHAGRLGPTKTRRERDVELSTRLRKALRGIQPDIARDDAPVFRAPEGGPLISSNFRERVFRRIVRKALGKDRRGVTPHSLRHTFASLHMARGTNLKWIQAMGGWSSAKMLLDVYGHYLPSESAGYADALTALDGPQAALSTTRIKGPRRGGRASARRARGKMEPTIRLERTTCSLRVSCSTS